MSGLYEMFLRAVLLVYVPGKSRFSTFAFGRDLELMEVSGSYILYTHMMAQRRRVMRGKQRAE